MDWVKSIYRCPECGAACASGPEVMCREGHRYPVRDGIADFVGTSDPNAQNWSLEWWVDEFCQGFYSSPAWKPMRDKMYQDEIGFSGLFDGDLTGLRILDAGCASGHFARMLAKQGGEVVAMDISTAVFSGSKRHPGIGNVAYVRGSSLCPPFMPKSFDRVISVGSLHHTGNTKKAFLGVADMVKPGGYLTVWIYDKAETLNPLTRNLVREWRTITTRLPQPFLLALSLLSIPLYYAYQFPLLGKIGYRLFPIGMFEQWQARVVQTIDLYGPLYMDCHTPEEVRGWFAEAGFDVTAEGRWPIGLAGRRRN